MTPPRISQPGTAASRSYEAVWRIESARVIAALARRTGDVGLAEDLAQDAFVSALEQWPVSGVPHSPGRVAGHSGQAALVRLVAQEGHARG